MKWQKFKKKPIVIEAFQITRKLLKQYPKYHVIVGGAVSGGDYVSIDTLEGQMKGKIGDWIIKGIEGELYPCKSDIFKLTYNPVIKL